ncbi:hypothetical protein EDC96DRAFT_542169 [Choanephora cucurbitarum]|nr:hypothetical protein EDC96DRAFT_542169 [Choanephora cucurbitarum]
MPIKVNAYWLKMVSIQLFITQSGMRLWQKKGEIALRRIQGLFLVSLNDISDMSNECASSNEDLLYINAEGPTKGVLSFNLLGSRVMYVKSTYTRDAINLANEHSIVSCCCFCCSISLPIQDQSLDSAFRYNIKSAWHDKKTLLCLIEILSTLHKVELEILRERNFQLHNVSRFNKKSKPQLLRSHGKAAAKRVRVYHHTNGDLVSELRIALISKVYATVHPDMPSKVLQHEGVGFCLSRRNCVLSVKSADCVARELVTAMARQRQNV